MIAISQLPDDLFVDIAALGRYACPLDVRDDQHKVRAELYHALKTGPVEAVRDALSHLAIAWSTDIHGKKIPPRKNWVNQRASELGDHLDDWMESHLAGHGLRMAA